LLDGIASKMLPEIYTIPAKPRLGALPILSLSSYDTRAGIFLDDFFPKAKGRGQVIPLVHSPY
jgi:hypothetical protein